VRARERLKEADARGWLVAGDYEALIDSVDVSMQVRDDVLCHGDLYDRHLVVDPDDGSLRGVIDWGDVHLGDPGVDLALAHRFLPTAAHPSFREAYGDIDEVRWRAARARAFGHALATLFYAKDVGDGALERGCFTALRYLRDFN
jgi:aminoglycoside phosphotransferase